MLFPKHKDLQLNKSLSEIFNNKVSLIYEYNKRSPLFVRMANSEIENNNTEKAIEILSNGIKIFPKYAASYLVLGRAYTLMGRYSLALKNFKIGSDLIYSPDTYQFYLKELENIKKQRSLFEGSTRNIFMSGDETQESEGESNLFEEGENRPLKQDDQSGVDDRLGQLAREISHAKIPESSNAEIKETKPLEGFASENLIVSETLAKIYIAQGELKEAIKVFRKLVIKYPDKKEYYLKRISELETELES